MFHELVDLSIRLLPTFVRRRLQPLPSHDKQEALDGYRARDPETNADTLPPEDEYIDLCCVWGVEFYTPAHLTQLIDGFRKLGWRADDHADLSRDPESWLRGLRRYQYGGSWMNLGYLVPKDSGPMLFGAEKHAAPLPECAKYASAGIHSISPSLVSVVMCFEFTDEASRLFDNTLRRSRQTYTTPVRRGFQIHDPRTQKTEHIGQIRNGITRQIGKWFSENLPGLFSSGILDYEIPTCEFVTLRKAEPFPTGPVQKNTPFEYLDILGLLRDFDVWKSSETPGLKFRMPRHEKRNPPYHSFLAINEAVHISAMPDMYGSTERGARIANVDEFMPNLLSLWAIEPMLEGYTQYLHKVRDSATSDPKARQAPAKILESIGGNVEYSIDIAAVTSELALQFQEGLPLVFSIETFEPCVDKFYGPKTTLKNRLELIVGKQATWLQGVDKSLRDHLTQYGSLVGAAENVRTQAKITFLTRALLVLAGATLVLTVLSFCMRGGAIEESMNTREPITISETAVSPSTLD